MNTEEFIKQASSDPEICQKMAACATPEEAYAAAQAAGVTDGYDRFCEVMQQVRDQVSNLSEDDLANLNAGLDTLETVTLSIGTAGASAIASAVSVAFAV